ncbi:sensor domain-containing diguanylate cyclase [Oxalicibacterium solurbis]|uniref:diguanylate cyclase n=1 Tax=Oxalicibacterium solurbis TaxID=69280 RepID=A0A8J3AZ01_9BURK|nr:sensor domain-containing diguanylate cyclase [Oxalicibacterium solurbis]GGI54096.1 hypothetical protein GCM10011430_12700 [Oxalicibacterium solurbis]
MIHDFASASQTTLHFLRERFGFDLWVLTRTEGNDRIVLTVEESGNNTKPGDVSRWSDSFCSRMVDGLGPRVAPRAQEIEAYATAPVTSQQQIGAYIGVPIRRSDGSLFGTLCAIDPQPQPDSIRNDQALVELLADLLGSLLNTELAATDNRRRAEHAEAEAASDGLTSLYNRRGWDQLMEREEERCKRYGNPACVISIDLDDLKRINDEQGHAAGDRLLQNASQALRAVARHHDVVARLGGDEFAILAVECDPVSAEALVARLKHKFQESGIRASIGHANRHPQQGLRAASEQADARMYADKKCRKSGDAISALQNSTIR